MKLSGNGRKLLACVGSVALSMGITSCGSYTAGYLWVMQGASSNNGTANVITGYKIDHNSGNLTEMVHSPYPSGGVNPVMGVMKPGGRYLYVLNQGDATNSVSEFSVGGDGVLTMQQSFATQGQTPVWMDISADGNYLYVLDTVGLDKTTTCASVTGLLSAPCGAITVFSIDGDTGRLALVQNQSIQIGGTYITYTPVGPAPTRIKTTSGSTVVVVNGDQTVTSLQVGSSGQLTVNANSTQVIDQTQTINITSITTGGSNLYLTDGLNNRILQYTVSPTGVLQPVTGGQVVNSIAGTGAVPVWTMTDSGGKYLYVLNQTNTTQNSNVPKSSISAYSLNGALTPASGNLNPYTTVGSGPVCMVEDPSHQWVYTSNQDGTVTGYHIDHASGTLQQLQHGSTFQAGGRPACLVVSGITS